MEFYLRKDVLDPAPVIEITESEYNSLGKSRTVLINALAIEEKYEILLSNYLEFEQELLRISSYYMVRRHVGYEEYFYVRLNLDIKMVNMLTAAKLYVDQLNQNVKECLPDVPHIKETVKSLFSREYDNNRYYRFMEVLRNYVQHRGIPVHNIQQPHRWTSHGEDGRLECSIEIASLKKILEEDKKIKKSVLAEFGDSIDLKAAARNYMECMSCIHIDARELVSETVNSSRLLIENKRSQYSQKCDSGLVSLAALKYDGSTKIESIPLLLDWDDVRLKLQNRNTKLTNLSKRYITNVVTSS